MARIDKVSQIVRATAGEALTGVKAVELDAGGSVVYASSADAIGVICVAGTIAAGAPVGVLVAGEIVEFSGTAGTKWYAVGTSGGTLDTTAGGTQVGFCVEATRLVVSM